MSNEKPFWSLDDVCRETNYTRQTIWLRVQKGTFPAPIRVNQRNLVWLPSVVEAWINERKNKRNKASA